MGITYAKVFSTLPESTLWTEPYATRIVWITMLATCDRDGLVLTTEPGLAKRANVTLAECLDALDRFQRPDEFSRTKSNDGKRIERIEGGWRLLNYASYRDLMTNEKRRKAKLDWWHKNKATKGYVKGRKAPEPIPRQPNAQTAVSPASHSPELARQAIQEGRQAIETAAPMPEHIRAILGRP